KEEIILAARPPGDRVNFILQASGLTLTPDGHGGYLARRPTGETPFVLPALTATDAAGRQGAANLVLEGASGHVHLDAAFPATAHYPITVDPTTIYYYAATDSTAYNSSPRLLRDGYGKLLLIGTVNE